MRRRAGPRPRSRSAGRIARRAPRPASRRGRAATQGVFGTAQRADDGPFPIKEGRRGDLAVFQPPPQSREVADQEVDRQEGLVPPEREAQNIAEREPDEPHGQHQRRGLRERRPGEAAADRPRGGRGGGHRAGGSIARMMASTTSSCPARPGGRGRGRRGDRGRRPRRRGRPIRCRPGRRCGRGRPCGRPRPARRSSSQRAADGFVVRIRTSALPPVARRTRSTASAQAGSNSSPRIPASQSLPPKKIVTRSGSGAWSSQRGISTRFCRSCVPPIAGLTIVTFDADTSPSAGPSAGRPRRPRGSPSGACR